MTESALNLHYAWAFNAREIRRFEERLAASFCRKRSTVFQRNQFSSTEGALKAETVRVFKPNLSVLASGGVICSHEQIISVSRFHPIILGFSARITPKTSTSLVSLPKSSFYVSKIAGILTMISILSLLTWNASQPAELTTR